MRHDVLGVERALLMAFAMFWRFSGRSSSVRLVGSRSSRRLEKADERCSR